MIMNVCGTIQRISTWKKPISAEAELFHNKKMHSMDEKSLIGQTGEIKKIKSTSDSNVVEIDVNQLKVEKKVSKELSVYLSQAMYRVS